MGGGFEFGIAHDADLFFDFRYGLGMSDMSSTSTTVKMRDVALLTGVRFNM